jgi:hypothetical protein
VTAVLDAAALERLTAEPPGWHSKGVPPRLADRSIADCVRRGDALASVGFAWPPMTLSEPALRRHRDAIAALRPALTGRPEGGEA